MHLSAACSHVVDIFNTLRKGHVDSRKKSPRTAYDLDPVSLFLTGANVQMQLL